MRIGGIGRFLRLCILDSWFGIGFMGCLGFRSFLVRRFRGFFF